MRADEHARMRSVEDNHFWFGATRRVIFEALERALGDRFPSANLLDIGCGTGYTLARLPKRMRTVGVDFSPTALAFARDRLGEKANTKLVRGSAYALPFANERFDAVLALDVLEHLEDDLGAAKEMRRVLKKGGVAVVTVPAFDELWSSHDEALDHQRRYRLAQIEEVLREAGFTIEHGTYYNFFLFPLVAAARMAGRLRAATGAAPDRSKSTDLRVPPAPMNAFLGSVLASERFLAPRMRLPIGVSCMVLARA
jgi:SAM-dependent methyltransferase